MIYDCHGITPLSLLWKIEQDAVEREMAQLKV